MPTESQARASMLPYVGRRVFRRLLYALYRRRLAALLALVLGVVGTGYVVVRGVLEGQSAAVGVLPVEVTVEQLQLQGDVLPLVLKERHGERRLALALQQTEARVIAREQGMRFAGEQPRAYDLMHDLVQQLGGRVDRVIVAPQEQGSHVGRIVVSTGGETRVVRARAADAVTLALKTGATVFVEDDLLRAETRGPR